MRRYWMAPNGDIEDETEYNRREVIPVVVGSREWAFAMTVQGHEVTDGRGGPCGLGYIADSWGKPDGWTRCPPSPPPLRRGERCRWTRGEDSGTGTYLEHTDSGHMVTIGGNAHWLNVETVERIEEGER